jgi:hypothetical protein
MGAAKVVPLVEEASRLVVMEIWVVAVGWLEAPRLTRTGAKAFEVVMAPEEAFHPRT